MMLRSHIRKSACAVLALLFLCSSIFSYTLPVSAEYFHSGDINSCVTVQSCIIIHVYNKEQTKVVGNYNYESPVIPVTSGNVDSAIATADNYILPDASAWLSDKGTFISEEISNNVNDFDTGNGLYRIIYWKAVILDGYTFPQQSAPPFDSTPIEHPMDLSNPFTASFPSEYHPDIDGDFIITLNQEVDVYRLHMALFSLIKERDFTVSAANGRTTITITSRWMHSLCNEYEYNRNQPFIIETRVGAYLGYVKVYTSHSPEELNGYTSRYQGWVEQSNGWAYYENGRAQIGWKKIDGKWYYFSYVSQVGWINIDGSWYYFLPSGEMATGWTNYNENWFYFDTNGLLKTDWQFIDGKWYYLHSTGILYRYNDRLECFIEVPGAMQTRWSLIDHQWYYFANDGAMKTNWQRIDGTWYYFGTNGAMRTNWQKIDGTWYYFGNDGAMRTNWQKIDGTWYYFGNDGAMRTNWQKVDGIWYFFGTNGAMRTDWQKIDGTWYYFGTNGSMRTGWQKTGSTWYYLKANGSMAQSEHLTINGIDYAFSSNGAWLP